MATWNVLLRGEDRMEFTVEEDADTADEARRQAEDSYPESRVLEVFDPAQRAEDLYHRAQRAYDDPYHYDDYDWC